MSYKEMFAKAEKAGNVEKVTPAYFEFEKAGDSVIGKFVGKTEVESSLGQGTYNQYLVDTDDGLIKFALGKATDREIEPILKHGGVYRFVFKGQEKLSGGRKVNQYVIDGFSVPDLDQPAGKEKIPF